MSDAVTVTKSEEPAFFTPKEQKLIIAAMGSLKSGQTIEIDIDTFVKLGEFNTKKTAQNQWATLKKKLIPATDGEGGVKMPSPTTPKKTPAKKRTKKESDGEDGEAQGGTPAKKAKTPKKTPAKKGKQTASEDDADEEVANNDASPKKKPVKPCGKKAATVVKDEVTENAGSEDTAADVIVEADRADSEVGEAGAESKETTPLANASEDTKMEGATE